ncbi:flagellar hook-length control protein FliK [Acidithiobacillus sulfurivorans]|uniref:Flagellar hook-length control protein-like C-terminal domain-containing protein n=1 Tax=Acidithiobacillus sulfurivorans TaxID=1958756 RepID=A0ABS5ZZ44_9PROT|nr:flagellar hook-length control protein FliK [Acidithiobacillus sulfurivorans]MBU2760492.1 hypothetical protein [Acidithiobacillus sulfurivorans]
MAAVSIVNPVSSSSPAPNPVGKVTAPAGNEKPDSIKFAAVMAKQQSREKPPQNSPEHSQPSAETARADAAYSVQSVSGKSLPQPQSNVRGQNGSVAKDSDHKKSKDQSVNPSITMTENLPSMVLPLPVIIPPGSSQALSSVDVSAESNAVTHMDGLGNQSAQVSDKSVLHRSSQPGLLQIADADHPVTDGKLTASIAHSAIQDGSSSQIVGHFLQNLAQAFAASSNTSAQSVASSAFSNSWADPSTQLLKTVSDSGVSLAGNGAPPLLASTIMLPPAASTPSAQVVAAPVGANPQWGEALGQQVQFLLGQGIQQATLQLNPPHLGPLEVHLDIQANGQANATFISPHPEVLQAISTAIPQLQQSFAAAGMSLGQANVGADGGGRFFSRNRSAPAGTVKSMTEPLDSTAPSTILRVHLGLINAFA